MRRIVGVWIGPPNGSKAPNPTSSQTIINTFAAPGALAAAGMVPSLVLHSGCQWLPGRPTFVVPYGSPTYFKDTESFKDIESRIVTPSGPVPPKF